MSLFLAFIAGITWTCSCGTIIISLDMECLPTSTKIKSKFKRRSESKERTKNNKKILMTQKEEENQEVKKTTSF
jgi:hypothetical protein